VVVARRAGDGGESPGGGGGGGVRVPAVARAATWDWSFHAGDAWGTVRGGSGMPAYDIEQYGCDS
jgi:hypothetical protein